MAAENDGVWSSQEWADTDVNISSFGEDDDGELFVVDLGGDIYRFVASKRAVFRRTSGRRVTPPDSDSGAR